MHDAQIAGGIWADTVGGKFVLAFGVVWWSIATALTPIAAKLGLPFLFVVRAFMGIGEVSASFNKFDPHFYFICFSTCYTIVVMLYLTCSFQ